MSVARGVMLADVEVPADAAEHPCGDDYCIEATASLAAEWDAFVGQHARASAYHAYGWRAVIERVFRQRTHYLACLGPGGRIDGVLPLVRLKSLLFGDFLVSLPYLNYGGMLSGSPAASSALVAHAVGLASRLGVSHIELREVGPGASGWRSRTDKVSMRLALPASVEALHRQLGPKLRAQIRRPVKEGAIAHSGGAELLDEFYDVFAENMRDLGTPVYSKSLFAGILQAFPLAARIFVVRVNGAPAAAGFTIAHRDMLEIPWASALRRYNRISVNMLLYGSVLEHAVQCGHAWFDFGRSTIDSGTYRFKKQWGAQPVQLHWQYWLRDGGEPPRLNPDNPKYRRAIAAWQRLPLPVANLLGPAIVRNLP